MSILRSLVRGALTLLLAAPLAHAQGLYVDARVDGPPASGPPQRLRLESHAVHANVVEHVARYRVEQTFRNETDATIEATYLFPIPREAIASGLSLRIGEQDVRGEILEASTAKETYRDIVRRVKDPALLEHAGEGLLRASIFPIGPRAPVRITFEFTAPVRRSGGLSSLALPLRFAGGTAARVTVDVGLESTRPLTTIYSPSHVVDVVRDGPRRARVTFEGKADAGRDFRLDYAVAEGDAPTLSLLTHRRRGEDGTFALLVAPPLAAFEQTSVPRDVVFVLDRSGSMAGEKWEQATKALAHGLRTLRSDDRFALVSFATDVRRFRDGLAAATAEATSAAATHLEGLQPAGGTNVDEALTAAFSSLEGGGDSLRMITFLTDGLPTVGVTDVPELLRRARTGAPADVRLFSFGVGYDVHTVLLDRLSREHGGVTEYVDAGENLEARVSGFFEKVQAPFLTGIRLDFGDAEVFDVDPPKLFDLFRGDSLLVTGRYRGDGPGAIRLFGSRAGAESSFVSDAAWPEEEDAHAFLPSLWAGRHVGTLLDEIRLNGARKELVDEVVRLGREYGVVTPYTSGLVVEEGLRLGRLAGLALPSPGRAGGAAPASPEAAEWDTRQRLDDLEAGDGADESKAVGRRAFEKAKELSELRDGAVAEVRRLDAAGATVERVDASGRVLYRVDGVLIERTLTEEALKSARAVTACSDAWFALLEQDPSLAELLALGDDLYFRLGEEVVHVVP